MASFRVQFDTNNAAFDGPDATDEIERVLRRVGAKVATGEREGVVQDTNGNTIGKWRWSRG